MLGPLSQVGDLNGVQGFWVWPGPALADTVIPELTQQRRLLSLSPVTTPFKQIDLKHTKKGQLGENPSLKEYFLNIINLKVRQCSR